MKYAICAGMYRSGSTWQYNVVSHLLEQRRGARRLGIPTKEDFAQRLDTSAIDGSVYVIKVHNQHSVFQEALAAKRAVGFYTYRDLRDVTYSLMHKFSSDFETIVDRKRLLHECLDNDSFWMSQPNVLCQRYEETLDDPVGAVEAIARHLDEPLTRSDAEALAAEYSLEANLQRTRALENKLREQGVDPNAPDHTLAHDERTQLHWNHIRSGQVGQWRTESEPDELVILSAICGHWLVLRRYEVDSSWVMPSLQSLGQVRRELQSELEWLKRRTGPFSLKLGLKIARQIYRLTAR